ncbi:MAG: class I SAM-dependent methyltransferase [Gammaproteobacteria bacterium]|nr:class I SAM-dependent methyltransferase [Gammaproteobacteria bacterium]
MNVATTPPCPSCAGAAQHVAALPRAAILESMAKLMPYAGAETCTFGDYALWRCTACGLVFADPMAEPGRDYYAWLTRSERYYPQARWEWTACADELRGLGASDRERRVLDVGCGSGRFLKALRGVPGWRAIGLDINQSSVDACLAQGFEATQGDLASARTKLDGGVEVVTLWHVVEHVADPVGLLLEARALLAPGGMIMFSVPLSPPSYEAVWRDPLNLPPHHLTRWNLRALERLAARVGLRSRLVIPDADSLLTRTVHALLVQAVSPFAPVTRVEKLRRLLAHALAHPALVWRTLRCQLAWPRRAGRVLPDVVLACFHLDDPAARH